MNLDKINKMLKTEMENPEAEDTGIDAYICSPYRADKTEGLQANIKAAKDYCRYALVQGYSPICSHLFFTQFLDDRKPEERALGLALGKRCIDFADVFFVFLNADRIISEGMQEEIEYAQSKGKAIKFITQTEVAAALKEAKPKAAAKKTPAK